MKYDYKEIGQRLKAKRESLGIEMKDLVQEIKIFEEYLVAIENGEIQNLPSEIYYSLFIRTYAKEVGLDVEQLLDETYLGPTIVEEDKKDKKSIEPVEKVVSTANTYTSPKKIFGWIAIVVLVIVLIVIIISVFFKDDKKETGSYYDYSTEAVANDVVDTVGELAMDTDTSVEETATEPAVSLSKSELTPYLPLTLDIEVKELSWILVLADGDTVLHRNLRPNDNRHLSAEDNFNLSLGNPNGVSLTLNNRPMRPLSKSGRAVTNLLITQGNKENYYLTNGNN